MQIRKEVKFHCCSSYKLTEKSKKLCPEEVQREKEQKNIARIYRPKINI